MKDWKFDFQQNFSAFNIHNIIKAGSLGHGTGVFGNFDVDLVIYSDGKQLNEVLVACVHYIQMYKWLCTDVKAEQIKISGYSYYLKDLDKFLRENLGGAYVQTEKEKRALAKGRSIQFTYRGKIEVDLLVSPNWKDQHELYRFLKDVRPIGNRSKYMLNLDTCILHH